MSEVRQNIAYACKNTQEAIDAGLNGFAVILLAESFGDDPNKFPLGGVMLVAHTHSHVPVYVTVSLTPPQIVDPVAFEEERETWLSSR